MTAAYKRYLKNALAAKTPPQAFRSAQRAVKLLRREIKPKDIKRLKRI